MQLMTSTMEIPRPATFDPDLPLVEASQRGDVSAFEELVRRYDRKLLRIAINVTHNPDDAEEAVQDAFFKAYRNLDRFRADAKFSTWLFRIAVNESLMKLRKQRGAKETAMAEQSFNLDDSEYGREIEATVPDWAPDPEARYGAAEFREILVGSLQKLSPALRVVFVLRDMEEHSISQTAEFLNLTENAVKSRLSRARAGLRQELGRYFKKAE
jgi:RNA polymerase sigma-70 factor (ECF subfamily)